MKITKHKILYIITAVIAFVFITRAFLNSGEIVIENGSVYRVTPLFGWKIKLDELYDPDFYEKNFITEDGVTYRIDTGNGKKYQVQDAFSNGFENITHLRELIGEKYLFTHFTLMSPKTPTVPAYNSLRKSILYENGDFLDNRIEPSAEHAKSGKQSLRFKAVLPSENMVCSKSSLSTSLLHFRKGDEVWFSAWFFLEKPGTGFFTFMDLESSFVKQHPGIRLRLNGGNLEMELAKWYPKPVYIQPESKRVPFPVGEWVKVKIHLTLSDIEDGVIRVWQNESLIIDAKGKNLPFAECVYDSCEIGISAYNFGEGPAVLYVDDMYIGKTAGGQKTEF